MGKEALLLVIVGIVAVTAILFSVEALSQLQNIIWIVATIAVLIVGLIFAKGHASSYTTRNRMREEIRKQHEMMTPKKIEE